MYDTNIGVSKSLRQATFFSLFSCKCNHLCFQALSVFQVLAKPRSTIKAKPIKAKHVHSGMVKPKNTHELITTVLRGSGSCADVSWVFLGFTMPEWTCFAFIGFALIVLLGLARTWKTDKA
jgi:disulfide bond formation protein DsbB